MTISRGAWRRGVSSTTWPSCYAAEHRCAWMEAGPGVSLLLRRLHRTAQHLREPGGDAPRAGAPVPGGTPRGTINERWACAGADPGEELHRVCLSACGQLDRIVQLLGKSYAVVLVDAFRKHLCVNGGGDRGTLGLLPSCPPSRRTASSLLLMWSSTARQGSSKC
jgi:hypothetical protein